MAGKSMLAYAVAEARGDSLATQRCNLLAPENEYLDPNPDLHSLFLEYNRMFFEGRLAGCEVKWSKRMTLCAGLCSFQPRSGFCSIRLSEPLLKLRPRSDMVNTLLHEMIHAYVFVATPVRDHEDHGPLFQAHMHRINKAAQTQITVFHTFHDEVDSYRQHVWQCNGPCRRTPPYFGLVKRSMNRPPGPTDRWWPDHERSCGGRYTKIKEPAEFTAKQAKKNERESAREEKKKKQEKEAKAAPSVKQFFPAINEDNECKTVRGDTKPSRAGKNATPRPGTENGSNKKQKKEHEAVDSNDLQWPPLGFPSTVPVIFSADGDEDGYFLVGDMQALFQTPPAQSRASDHQNRTERLLSDQGATVSTPSDASAVVDLTVSDSDASDNEQAKTETKSSTVAVPRTMCEQPTTQNAHVIEID